MNNVGHLYLENGKKISGRQLGDWNTLEPGEVVFNTSMVGYQEIFSDPSYAKQIVTLTYPLVANYSLSSLAMQSTKPWLNGVVIKEFFTPDDPDFKNLNHLLIKFKIPGLYDVDTRSLTKILRSNGSLKGIFSKEKNNTPIWTDVHLNDHVKLVSTQTKYHIPGTGPRIAVIDLGVKKGILSKLLNLGCSLDILPYNFTKEDIEQLEPDGILLSNGPGDPKELLFQVPLIQELQKKFPIFGICLGHQLFCLANGCETEKMSYGHRGGNQPVIDLQLNQCQVTSQNHGYHVTKKSLEKSPLKITHINLNDQSIEGVEHKDYPSFSVQFHPEAEPGPEDSAYLFEKFLNHVRSS